MNPFKLPLSYEPTFGRIQDSDGAAICMVYQRNEQTHAQFILQAVNAHDTLLAALEVANDWFDTHLNTVKPLADHFTTTAIDSAIRMQDIIAAAIAKARGG